MNHTSGVQEVAVMAGSGVRIEFRFYTGSGARHARSRPGMYGVVHVAGGATV